MTNDKFKIANVLTRTIMPLKLYERKLFYYALCSFPEKQVSVEIPIKQFIEDMNIDKGGHQLKEIRTAMRNLVKDTTVLITEDISPTGEDIACSVIEKVIRRGNIIEISRPKEIIPLLDDIKKDYTYFFLNELIKLEGMYSPKIYQMCRILLQRSNNKILDYKWYIDSTPSNHNENLRTWLNLPFNNVKKTTYNNFTNIQDKILLPAIQEINEKCNDCFIDYNPKENKRGVKNKVEYIVLHIKEKNPIITEKLTSTIRWIKNVPEYNEMTSYSCEEIAKIIEDLLNFENLYFSWINEQFLFDMKIGLFRFIFYYVGFKMKDENIISKLKFAKNKLQFIIQKGLYKNIYNPSDVVSQNQFNNIMLITNSSNLSIIDFKNIVKSIYDKENEKTKEPEMDDWLIEWYKKVEGTKYDN